MGDTEDTAQSLGLRIAAPAKDFLLQKSLPALNKANEEDRLERRRQEIEKNTAALIRFIATEQPKGEFAGPEITYQHLILGLSAFCRRYPDFYPFCTSER